MGITASPTIANKSVQRGFIQLTAGQVFLNKGNTAKLVINASGGTRNADMNAEASFNYFSGSLVSGGEL